MGPIGSDRSNRSRTKDRPEPTEPVDPVDLVDLLDPVDLLARLIVVQMFFQGVLVFLVLLRLVLRETARALGFHACARLLFR